MKFKEFKLEEFDLHCVLDLRNNKITELKGLDNLEYLGELYIDYRKIQLSLNKSLGGADRDGRVKNAQKFVEYCRKNKTKISKKQEEELELELQKQFEKETGKHEVWVGKLTKVYLTWKEQK